jgi:hypothetical protein
VEDVGFPSHTPLSLELFPLLSILVSTHRVWLAVIFLSASSEEQNGSVSILICV